MSNIASYSSSFRAIYFKKSIGGNIGLIGIGLLVIIGYLIPLIINLQPYEITNNRLLSPGWFNYQSQFPLGTDDLGRDILSRIIQGAQISLSIGFVVVLVSSCIGSILGLLAAVYRGWIDSLIIKITDLLMSLPSILLAIVIVAVFGSGLVNAMLAIILVSIPRYIRIVRSVALAEMEKQYVQAAKSFGTPKYKILWCEVAPNCRAPIIVQSTLGFSDAILDIAALGFLGLGASPPIAEWGGMLADARPYIESNPILVILPGLCILITVFCFNLVGDALRDSLDPKLQVIKYD